MMCCCVDDCKKSVQRRGYCFPKNADKRKKWIEAIGKDENWSPRASDKVCFRHFREKDYLTPSEFGRNINFYFTSLLTMNLLFYSYSFCCFS